MPLAQLKLLRLLNALYSPQVIDHFERPRNSGTMDSPDINVQSENPACGDIMRLMLRLNGDIVSQVRYQVRGCVAAIACGSALTEALLGKTLVEAGTIRRESLVQTLGGLSNESMHASHLAMECLNLALKAQPK